MSPDLLPVHDLLLAVAGRVDDDLLTWARELVAVGEEGRGVELLTAALIADRVALPEPVRAALVAAGRAARSVLDADAALPPPHVEDGTPHVFDGPQAVAVTDTVAATMHELFERQGIDGRVWLAWRRTPAGSATGPLPHPVVLVELAAGDATAGADVLAYQLTTALERGGVAASVEVFAHGAALPEYQRAARRAGRVLAGRTPEVEAPAVWRADAAPPDMVERAGAETEPAAAPPGPEASPEPAVEVDPEPIGDDPAPDVETGAGRHGLGTERDAASPSDRILWAEPVRRAEPGELDRPPVPAAVVAWWAAAGSPAVERTEQQPDVDPAGAEPAADAPPAPAVLLGRDEPPADPVVESGAELGAGPRPRPRAVPALADDPLNGPLREPLLAPLLDPTPGEVDAVDDLFTAGTSGTGGFGPAPGHPAAARPDPGPPPSGAGRPPRPPGSERPPAPDRAFAPRSGPEPEPRLGPVVGTADPAPGGPWPDPESDTPVQGEFLVDPTRLGLRPESLERLSPTDRALLARLQSEMRKPARPAPLRPQPRPRPLRAEPPDIAG